MKKIINILILLCITFAYSFAQISTNMSTMIDSLNLSARKRSTAGKFSRDSDNLNAKNVFNLDRVIFSAGYVPNLNSSSNQVVQAFFGVPILNNAMYFGLAGAYSMSERRVDYSNPTGTGTALSSYYLAKNVTTASSFALRPVFKINDMISLHYLIARGGVKSSTNGYTSHLDDNNYSVITNSSANTEWVHEIAVGLKLGDMKFNIPIRFYIDNNNYTKSYSKTISGVYVDANNYGNSETITARTNIGSSSPVKMTLAPEFYMPLVSGPMTGINAGLILGFDIYNPYKKTSNYTNATTETKNADGTYSRNTDNSSSVTERKKIFGMDFDINAYPTLEWNLADNRVRLIMEPKVGVSVRFWKRGEAPVSYKSDNTSYSQAADGTVNQETISSERSQNTNTYSKYSYTTTTPYVELPIGTVFTPVNWFEFRAGLSYRLAFPMNNYSYEYANGGKAKEFDYTFTSQMDLFTGMGFIIGEDFFIDLFLVAGTKFQQGASTGKSIFDIDAWGAQLSYRL